MGMLVYIHYLKVVDFLRYEPVIVRTGFSSQDDIQVYILFKDVYIDRQKEGLILRRKHWYERVLLWKRRVK